jgi:hypothetical protein
MIATIVFEEKKELKLDASTIQKLPKESFIRIGLSIDSEVIAQRPISDIALTFLSRFLPLYDVNMKMPTEIYDSYIDALGFNIGKLYESIAEEKNSIKILCEIANLGNYLGLDMLCETTGVAIAILIKYKTLDRIKELISLNVED